MVVLSFSSILARIGKIPQPCSFSLNLLARSWIMRTGFLKVQ